jgi:hypothetical protein
MTQCDKILKVLQDDGSITSWQAMQEFGIMRLASRINDLKRAGYNINREMVKSKNRHGEPITYAKYTLADNVADCNT